MSAFSWNPIGAFATFVMIVACALGYFVFATRRDRSQNRLLAVALVLGGVSAGFYFGVAALASQRETASAAMATGITMLIPLPAVYLLFLATIPTPVTEFLRRRSVTIAIVAGACALGAWRFIAPDAFIPPMRYWQHMGAWHMDLSMPAPGTRAVLFPVLGMVQLFGFFVAFSAYRRATSPTARMQARAFAIAFGTRDLLQVAFIMTFNILPGASTPLGEQLFFITIPAVDLLFYVLLAYGILSVQLFDIQLRLKWVIERSTVAAPFAAVFFIITESLESLVPFDSFWAGLAAASLIVLGLQPLQRFASRVAERVLPGVAHTADYLATRKHQVYEHAVEAILADSRISSAERRVLERLRDDLGLSQMEAAALERDVSARMAAVPRAIVLRGA